MLRVTWESRDAKSLRDFDKVLLEIWELLLTQILIFFRKKFWQDIVYRMKVIHFDKNSWSFGSRWAPFGSEQARRASKVVCIERRWSNIYKLNMSGTSSSSWQNVTVSYGFQANLFKF